MCPVFGRRAKIADLIEKPEKVSRLVILVPRTKIGIIKLILSLLHNSQRVECYLGDDWAEHYVNTSR